MTDDYTEAAPETFGFRRRPDLDQGTDTAWKRPDGALCFVDRHGPGLVWRLTKDGKTVWGVIGGRMKATA